MNEWIVFFYFLSFYFVFLSFHFVFLSFCFLDFWLLIFLIFLFLWLFLSFYGFLFFSSSEYLFIPLIFWWKKKKPSHLQSNTILSQLLQHPFIRTNQIRIRLLKNRQKLRTNRINTHLFLSSIQKGNSNSSNTHTTKQTTQKIERIVCPYDNTCFFYHCSRCQDLVCNS